MAVNMPKDASTQYGCVVIDEETQKARHYVEKPENFISSTINAGVYVFDAKSIFDELKNAVDFKSDAANVCVATSSAGCRKASDTAFFVFVFVQARLSRACQP